MENKKNIKKNKISMDNEHRAKQFSPFSALTGFEMELYKKEYANQKIDKFILSDEMKELLDEKMKDIRKNDIVDVLYYDDGGYYHTVGKISWEKINRKIIIGDNEIKFDDIFDITCISEKKHDI